MRKFLRSQHFFFGYSMSIEERSLSSFKKVCVNSFQAMDELKQLLNEPELAQDAKAEMEQNEQDMYSLLVSIVEDICQVPPPPRPFFCRYF